MKRVLRGRLQGGRQGHQLHLNAQDLQALPHAPSPLPVAALPLSPSPVGQAALSGVGSAKRRGEPVRGSEMGRKRKVSCDGGLSRFDRSFSIRFCPPKEEALLDRLEISKAEWNELFVSCLPSPCAPL